ncbi:MAG: PRC and DUF2382 domain-containing protein [Rubrobacteraceae bacterium]
MADKTDDRFREVEDMYDGYQVNDRDGEKIGKVDDLFVDEDNEAEYIGVKMGLLGMNSTLVPMDACRVDESEQTITVSAEKSHVQDGPDFNDDEAISPDFERRVRSHYGLEGHDGESDRSGYGAYYSDDDDDVVSETSGRSETSESTGTDDDELRVQRTEEELRAGTREREAGGVNVRKRVRTDKEQVTVPKKREEVSVERVPVDEESADAEIGDDEISVPVVEEEVVIEKKAVVKEELRIKKDTVEEEEVIEEDVRKEEIDVDDTSKRRDR